MTSTVTGVGSGRIVFWDEHPDWELNYNVGVSGNVGVSAVLRNRESNFSLRIVDFTGEGYGVEATAFDNKKTIHWGSKNGVYPAIPHEVLNEFFLRVFEPELFANEL